MKKNKNTFCCFLMLIALLTMLTGVLFACSNKEPNDSNPDEVKPKKLSVTVFKNSDTTPIQDLTQTLEILNTDTYTFNIDTTI